MNSPNAASTRFPRRPQIVEGNLSAIKARQLECLQWVQQGKSASEIGIILGISSRTVEGHLAHLCEILGVRTRIQAVVLAQDLGLLQPARKPTWASQVGLRLEPPAG